MQVILGTMFSVYMEKEKHDGTAAIAIGEALVVLTVFNERVKM